jgi:hypothetical protein
MMVMAAFVGGVFRTVGDRRVSIWPDHDGFLVVVRDLSVLVEYRRFGSFLAADLFARSAVGGDLLAR